MTAKEVTLVASLVASSFGAGVGVHTMAASPSAVVVHHVELTLRPQPDGGTELDETAFGKRAGKHTGASATCSPLEVCSECIRRASDNCTWGL